MVDCPACALGFGHSLSSSQRPGPATACSPRRQPGSGEQARAAASSPLKPGLRGARGWNASQRSSPSALQGEPGPPPEPGQGGSASPRGSEGRLGAHPGFWRECFRSLRAAFRPSRQPWTRSAILFLFCPLSARLFACLLYLPMYLKGNCSYREAESRLYSKNQTSRLNCPSAGKALTFRF